ncbi:uncharacterized protein LOC141683691 [Apium graveolens]|uniref:uncharacterized protein LOC141683691 n=1 Tax=Apium graveolens TaxID=4045 RepID=UPI003D7AB5CE
MASSSRVILESVWRNKEVVGSLNVGTLTGQFLELVDELNKRYVDAVCVGAKTKEANDFKLWYLGVVTNRNGVVIMLGTYLRNNVVEVNRFGDRVMMIKLVLDVVVVNLVSAYAPHAGDDFNGHIGKFSDGYVGTHRGLGYGMRNEGRCILLEFALAHDFVIVNSCFKKRDPHLITFKSGGCSTQIDYFLTRKSNKNFKDYKVFPNEKCATQHHLLVMDIYMRRKIMVGVPEATPRILWKNLKGERVRIFKERIGLEQRSFEEADVNQLWYQVASLIRGIAKDVLGSTSGKIHDQKEAWWWNADVQERVKDKQAHFKELMCCNEQEEFDTKKTIYKEAKRLDKKAVRE